ncbi:MAG: branched-chain amino acid transport system II carrier protein [Butyricicoccus sp.]
MQKLNRRSLLLVGFTLFSMFFGAGNLIFPPYLGAQAGADAWLAFVGFAVSAIGLPVIGVIAVARAGGLSELAGRVHPRFAQVFALLVLPVSRCVWPSRARRAHRSKCSRRSLAEMQCGS